MRDRLVIFLMALLMITWATSTWVIIKLNDALLTSRTQCLMAYGSMEDARVLSITNELVAAHLEELVLILDPTPPRLLIPGASLHTGIGGGITSSEKGGKSNE